MNVESWAGRLFSSAGLPSEQRGELGLQARGLELEDAFRASEVLQPVDAEILERRLGRNPVAHQGGRRLGEQDLAAVPDRGHPGGAVDI